jgi:dienelactone hydrolase
VDTSSIVAIGFCFGGHAAIELARSGEGVRSVVSFHAAALGAGAKDNGGPGVRPEYHDAYYAAFVLSPEGHNIEAVCFEDEY